MNICVFGSASDKIDEIYKQKTFELGVRLAKANHTLIFGAGSSGLMGACARGVDSIKGNMHGVIPKFFEEGGYEEIYYNCDTLTYTQTMAERKGKMNELCDAFIIVPGGIGTYEEFFEIFTLKQLGRHQKAIAIYNINGYYDDMLALLNNAIKQGFINPECQKLIASFDNLDDVLEYVKNYTPEDVEWSRLKHTDNE